MIDALVSGKLIKDPSTKTGPSGKQFCNFLLSVAVGEESPVIVSGIAFQETAERIAKLAKGDAVAVVGSLKPSQWQDRSTGEEKHGLNVTVSACLSAYDVKKRRGGDDGSGKTKKPARPSGDGFDDPVDF